MALQTTVKAHRNGTPLTLGELREYVQAMEHQPDEAELRAEMAKGSGPQPLKALWAEPATPNGRDMPVPELTR